MKENKISVPYLDKLWAEFIKLRAGSKCEYCGKPDGLNSHHIFSRSNGSVRWEPDNGISLCVSHHVFGNFSAHKSPIEFVEWIKKVRGKDWYSRLRKKAVKIGRPDMKAQAIFLREQIEKL